MQRWRAVLADLMCVLIFVVIGRRQHGEESAVSGVVTTAAPFLIGLVIASCIGKLRGKPADTVLAGVYTWVTTVLLGLLLRRFVFDRGTAAAFVIVAILFLGATLIGWRALAAVRQRQVDAA